MDKYTLGALEEIRALAYRESESIHLPNAPKDAFEFAARSKLNGKKATAGELRKNLATPAQPYILSKSAWWATGLATAASAVIGLYMLFARPGLTDCPPAAGRLEISGDNLSYSCQCATNRFLVTLHSGNFELVFKSPPQAAQKRSIRIEKIKSEIEITGTTLKISVPANNSAVRIILREGRADLITESKRQPLETGKEYTADGNTVIQNALESRPKTLADLKAKYGNLAKISLYNGKEIEGSIITRGEIYHVTTLSGTMRIKKDDILKETPL